MITYYDHGLWVRQCSDMDLSSNSLEIESNHLLHSNLLFHGEISFFFRRVLDCNRGRPWFFDLLRASQPSNAYLAI